MTEIESKHIPDPRECKFYGSPCNMNNLLLRPGGCECEKDNTVWNPDNYPFPRGIHNVIHNYIERQISEGKTIDEIMNECVYAKGYILQCRTKNDQT